MPKKGQKKRVFNIPKREVSALLWGAQNLNDERYSWAFDCFALMYVLGLRIGEVVLLRYDHKGTIDAQGLIRSVLVPTLKKTKRKAAPPDAPAAAAPVKQPPVPTFEVPVLAHFDWVRAAFDSSRRKGRAAISRYLFPSPRDPARPISVRMVTEAFVLAARRGGVMDGATSHALRHTVATELHRYLTLQAGEKDEVAFAAVGRFLRHAKGKVWTGKGSDPYATTRLYVHTDDGKYAGLNDWMPAIRARAIAVPRPEPALRIVGLGLA